MKFIQQITAILSLTSVVLATPFPKEKESEWVTEVHGVGPGVCITPYTIIQTYGPTKTIYAKTSTVTKKVDCGPCDLQVETKIEMNEPATKTVKVKKATTVTQPVCSFTCTTAAYTTITKTIAPTITVAAATAALDKAIICKDCRLVVYTMTMVISKKGFTPTPGQKIVTKTAKGSTTLQYIPMCTQLPGSKFKF